MKNNIIVKAKYELNTIENRMFQVILFNFQKHNDNTLKSIISKKDLAKVVIRSDYKTEKSISTILLKLRKSDVFYYNKNTNSYGNYGFINGFEYNTNTETYTIEIKKEVYELLTSYIKGYTPINMDIFLKFKSFYAQRLYELLRLWSNTKHTINYSIEELKELLMLDKKHSAYCDFKKRVMTPAIKELNEKALMQVEIKEHKINRKVASIDFIVTDKDDRKYFEKDKKQHQEEDQQQHKNYKSKNKELKFKNFDERDYDYKKLERQLLGWEND